MLNKLTNNHSFRVAKNFEPFTELWFLALLHDTVEDNKWLQILTRPFLPLWPALDSITRRPDEVYLNEYIPRVMSSQSGVIVKYFDLKDNLSRNRSGSYNMSLFVRHSNAMKQVKYMIKTIKRNYPGKWPCLEKEDI